jgi:hypothetical protein
MNDITQHSEERPWFREPYVWMIIFIPFTAVIMGVVMINLAIKTNDGLVDDDYYKKGLEINRTLARDKAATTHGLSATMLFSAVSKRIEVSVRSASTYTPPPYLELVFRHTTREGFDHFLHLERIGEGEYQSELPTFEAGHWRILITADDWRLVGTVRTPMSANQSILLEPPTSE